jgi:hypothetical protein
MKWFEAFDGMTRRQFWGLVGALAALHALLAALLPLSGDESYYWDCSRHPSWAYFDQPGLVIWAIAPFRLLLGDTSLAVRGPAIVASALMAFFLLGLVRRLGGSAGDAAKAYLLLHAMPIYFLGSFYASTDVAMATAYVAATWAAVAVAQGERRGWWGFGVACGLGFLAKFPVVIVAPALLPALLVPRVRAHLKTATPYLAGLLSLLLTGPVWLWGAQHQWDNITFQLEGRHAASSGVQLKYLGEFLAGNLLLATPFLFFALAIALVKAWGLRRRQPGWATVGIAALMPFLFFGFVALKERVGLHWAAQGLVLGAVAVVLIPFRGRKPLVTLAAVTGLALSLLIVVAGSQPERLLNVVWPDRTEAPSETAEDVAKMLDNERIAEALQRRHQPGELVGSESYSLVHQFAFLSGGELPTRLANIGGGHHGLASLYWHKPEELRGRNALFLTEKSHLDAQIHALFAACTEEEPITVERGGHTVRTLRLFRCRDLLEPVPLWTRLAP